MIFNIIKIIYYYIYKLLFYKYLFIFLINNII